MLGRQDLDRCATQLLSCSHPALPNVWKCFRRSLRDALAFASFPALEAPGYFQTPRWGATLCRSSQGEFVQFW